MATYYVNNVTGDNGDGVRCAVHHRLGAFSPAVEMATRTNTLDLANCRCVVRDTCRVCRHMGHGFHRIRRAGTTGRGYGLVGRTGRGYGADTPVVTGLVELWGCSHLMSRP